MHIYKECEQSVIWAMWWRHSGLVVYVHMHYIPPHFSKAFCMVRMYILERIDFISNSILYISAQYNLLQINKAEETVDLFTLPAMTSP